MLDARGPDEDVAQRNWANALDTYRRALTAYRRLLELRSQREMRDSREILAIPVPALEQVAYAAHLAELTPREREVAALIALGYSNQQIADALVVTRGTVANHVAHILAKLGAANRTQIAARVLEATEGQGWSDKHDARGSVATRRPKETRALS